MTGLEDLGGNALGLSQTSVQAQEVQMIEGGGRGALAGVENVTLDHWTMVAVELGIGDKIMEEIGAGEVGEIEETMVVEIDLDHRRQADQSLWARIEIDIKFEMTSRKLEPRSERGTLRRRGRRKRSKEYRD